jgi:hypothetical protein
MAEDYDDEVDDEIDEEFLSEDEEIMREDVEIPDVPWAEDIARIENPDIRDKEIERAEKWLEKTEKLEAKYESEGKDFRGFLAENPDLSTEATKASTRASLESVGLTWDHLGDVSQDMGLLAARDLNALDQKDRVRNFIRDAGPETAQELADRMHEEGRLGEEAYETISRLVRIQESESE